MLGYYDTFSSDLFVDESHDVISREYISKSNYSTKDFPQSPGVDDYSAEEHDFHDYLVGIAKNEVGDDPEADGIKSSMGKDKWQFSTILSILKNEKYKGDALVQKNYVPDFKRTSQRKTMVSCSSTTKRIIMNQLSHHMNGT